MNIVSTKMTNTIATNVISTASINCHSKKSKRLMIILLLIIIIIIIIICYYYTKQKGINALTIQNVKYPYDIIISIT